MMEHDQDTPGTLEAVRLVIWDLDETFWKGTVSEGGHVYSKEAHDTVIALAKRGIVSSICSKNDRSAVERILKNEGIWDYFVFPSIDWSPKGHRVASIVKAFKLRPPTVLFIDDNPTNLAEASHFCEGIQVSNESIVPNLLSSPLLLGKDDETLTRLLQYKVLEQKSQDMDLSGGDNESFLRNSNIRVYIEHNVEANIDRAVELINRTNQLNFTKARLSENSDAARAELLVDLQSYDVNTGLVYATDRYGDYGCIGFYLMKHREGIGRRLVHYCFSCRTLGMEIETWMYSRLGKPSLKIQGDVLTDIKNPKVEVDWVTEVSGFDGLSQGLSAEMRLNNLVVRGGCDVRAVEHYVEALFRKSFEEMNVIVNGVPLRTDHSIFLRYALDGISAEGLKAVEPLLLKSEHFTSQIVNLTDELRNVVLLSLWSDGRYNLYRDRVSGVLVPVYLPDHPNLGSLLSLNVKELEEALPNEFARRAAACLRESYEFHGQINYDMYRETIAKLLARIPQHTLLIFIQTPIFWYRKDSDEKYFLVRERVLNDVNIELAGCRKNVAILDPHVFATGREEYLDFLHFTRPVYQRIGTAIRAAIDAFFGN